MDLFEQNSAVFSEDRQYRYVLSRYWDMTLPIIMFIGLNPSTANETEPDPTINKVRKVAAKNGYGGFIMCNLFGIISAHPEILLTHPNPVGDQDDYLEAYSRIAKDVCFCWGVFKQAAQRREHVMKMFSNALCFKHTKDGHPWHPLYCLDETKLIKF